MPARTSERLAVVLIGHGAPATDCPPELIGQLMALEWGGARAPHDAGAGNGPPASGGTPPADGGPGSPPADGGHRLEGRAAELDAKIRDWPRRSDNDPYKAGLEQLMAALQPLLPTDLVAIGYNEFCRPTIAEAVAQVIQRGATRILVIPSMLTPGGVHAERDIPLALQAARHAHPGVTIDYGWPFDLPQVAALFAGHITSWCLRYNSPR